jgi:hypothetical protein
MVRYKIVFKDGDFEKTVFGDIAFEENLVKVDTDLGNIVYINKSNIIFMKELTEKNHD